MSGTCVDFHFTEKLSCELRYHGSMVDLIGEQGMNFLDLFGQFQVLAGRKGLSSIAKCFFRKGMNFDNQAVGTNCNSRTGQRIDHIIVTTSV